MRILVIHNEYKQSSGEGQVVAQEIKMLRDAGEEVITYQRSNEELEGISAWNKLVGPDSIFGSKHTSIDVKRLIETKRPDVAHVHNTFFMISPSIYEVFWRCDVPVVQTLHNYRLMCPSAIFYRSGKVCEDCLSKQFPWPGILHRCYRDSLTESTGIAGVLGVHHALRTWHEQVDMFIALTKFARAKHIEGGYPESKFAVKPNFLGADPGQRSSSLEHILFVGRLSHEKGLHTLLRAWQSLQGIPLKIVGDGPLRATLETFIRTHQIGGVELLGKQGQEDVLTLMKRAHFLVFPSEWYEGFPMTLLEAFACGVPVIASRLGAMEEIIEDHRTGLLFAPQDPTALSQTVRWAASHPKELRIMGDLARDTFLNTYTAKQNYQSLMNIYNCAIKKRQRIKARSPQQNVRELA